MTLLKQALTFYGSEAIIGHVGDTRLYAVERGTKKLAQITKDHSVVQRLMELGHITEEEAIDHPQRSFLYLSLGQAKPIIPDVKQLTLNGISHVMLCSDGLWKLVDDAYIAQILTSALSPAKACQQLIQAANNAGGTDNISVIVCKFED